MKNIITESLPENNTIKDSYLVEGMTCTGCERSINLSLNKLEGINSAKADLGSSSVSVEYDPSVISVDKIKSAVNKLGYKIVDKKAPEGKDEGRDGCCS